MKAPAGSFTVYFHVHDISTMKLHINFGIINCFIKQQEISSRLNQARILLRDKTYA